MVEGHSVHRVAGSLTKRLVGKRLAATSPNGRFSAGAKAIDGRSFSRVEAVGKNLFCFFATAGLPDVVVHVHFGMSGKWSIADAARAPEPKPTTRLQLTGHGLVSQLSAMTVQEGGQELFDEKVSKLGCDPLRDDGDVERLWGKVSASKKSIGSLCMDQGFFAGVGNIYRAEILFVAGLHPEIKGNELSRAQFDRVWAATVSLMRRGYVGGSILTVDPAEAVALGKPSLRRYIYNSAKCGRCGTGVRSWDVQGRTCYVCPNCQPRDGAEPSSAKPKTAPAEAEPKTAPAEAEIGTPPRLFTSHCAPESLEERMRTPAKLRVAELRSALEAAGLPSKGLRKAELVQELQAHLATPEAERTPNIEETEPLEVPEVSAVPAGAIRSARAAARDKALAGESRAVEHVADDEERLSSALEEDWVRLDEDGSGASSGRARGRKSKRSPRAEGTTEGMDEDIENVSGVVRSTASSAKPKRRARSSTV